MVAVKSSVDYRLKRFNPTSMETNRICIMLGKKGTGKSSLMRDILWVHQNIPCGAVMSSTEEANENFAKMAPPLFIYKDFDADALQNICNRQKKMKAMLKQNNDQLPFDHRAFVVLDDCMYDKKNFKSILIRELFMNGRHWDLFVLLSMQYIMDITPEIRSNTDYLFALKDGNRKNRMKLYEEYFGMFPSFAVFDALFLEVCQDYRCLVLDNTVPTTNVEECVFWYKAEKRPDFTLGADWWWEYARQKGGGARGNDGKEKQRLEEMNKKAVHVVMEPKASTRQQESPPPAQYSQSAWSQEHFPAPPPRPRQEQRYQQPVARAQTSQIQFSNPGHKRAAPPLPRPVQPQQYGQPQQQRHQQEQRRVQQPVDDSPPEYGYEYRQTERARQAGFQHEYEQVTQPTTFIQTFQNQPQRAAFSASLPDTDPTGGFWF